MRREVERRTDRVLSMEDWECVDVRFGGMEGSGGASQDLRSLARNAIGSTSLRKNGQIVLPKYRRHEREK